MEKNQVKKTIKIGVVVDNKAKKTVAVLVERPVRHPLYKKIIKKKKKFLVHDEYEKCKVGDTVKIVETRPLSKRKIWSITPHALHYCLLQYFDNCWIINFYLVYHS